MSDKVLINREWYDWVEPVKVSADKGGLSDTHAADNRQQFSEIDMPPGDSHSPTTRQESEFV